MKHPHVHFMNATSQAGCKWIYLQPGLSTLLGRLELQKQPCAVYRVWPSHSHIT